MKYNIGKVAEAVGLATSTLRFYEKEGLLPEIKRDKNGIRVFDDDDIFWIDIIKCLRETGMNISDIRNIVELSSQGDSTIEERKIILNNHRKKIEEEIKLLKKYMKKIDLKLQWYEGKNEKC